MLKTIGSTGSAANSKGIKGKAGGNSIVSNSIVDSVEATNQTNPTKEKKTGKNN